MMVSRLVLTIGVTLLVNFCSVNVAEPVDRCKACSKVTAGIQKGMDRTAEKGWTGGDTSWHEERNLRYDTSETRLIEVVEHACDAKDHNCHYFMAEYEHKVEEWFFDGATVNLFFKLCITEARVCCPPAKFGPKCQECPKDDKNNKVCGGHGTCEGAGSRIGTGKCKCDTAYKGKLCDKCAKGHYRDDSDNCRDFDECEHSISICKQNEVCRNTPGSFECNCKLAWRRENGVCVPTPTKTASPVDEASTAKAEPTCVKCGWKERVYSWFGTGSCEAECTSKQAEIQSNASGSKNEL
eukprot:CFRG0912T1